MLFAADQSDRNRRLTSLGWLGQRPVALFCHAIFTACAKHHLSKDGQIVQNQQQVQGKEIRAALDFGQIKEKSLLIKVALSSVDADGARKIWRPN